MIWRGTETDSGKGETSLLGLSCSTCDWTHVWPVVGERSGALTKEVDEAASDGRASSAGRTWGGKGRAVAVGRGHCGRMRAERRGGLLLTCVLGLAAHQSEQSSRSGVEVVDDVV